MGINEFVMANEKVIRMGFFFGILAVMALWELLAPRRTLTDLPLRTALLLVGWVTIQQTLLPSTVASKMAQSFFASTRSWACADAPPEKTDTARKKAVAVIAARLVKSRMLASYSSG